jgi:hypothetical protein
MSATPVQTVTVDRELLRSLVLEATAVIEVFETLAGCSGTPLTEPLGLAAEAECERIGIPSEPIWDESLVRRDELLGRREAVAS